MHIFVIIKVLYAQKSPIYERADRPGGHRHHPQGWYLCPVVPQHKQGIGLFDKPDLQDLFLDGRADGGRTQ